jgi:hypothetical protein
MQALCPSLLQEFTFLLSIVKSLHMCDILSTQILKQHKSEMTSFSINWNIFFSILPEDMMLCFPTVHYRILFPFIYK